MKKYGPPEHVYVEREWYDGPRAGIADVNGIAHRFKSLFDESADEYSDLFEVWPVDAQVLRLEIEQWCLFVAWNDLYESGEAGTDSHPGHGGLNARWDEIDASLRSDRAQAPEHAKRVTGQLVRIDRDRRYDASGPDYSMCWWFE